LFWSSWIFGVYCWFYSFLLAGQSLGTVWVIIGLLFGGVGVIPLAIIGSLIRHWWMGAGEVGFALLLTLAARIGGLKALIVEPD